MDTSVLTQFYTFLYCMIIGVRIAVMYDIVRLFRIAIPHNMLFINLEDILYWFAVDVYVLSELTIRDGYSIRLYMFIGMVVGAFFYLGTFGYAIKYFMNHIKKYVVKRIKAKERVEK